MCLLGRVIGQRQVLDLAESRKRREQRLHLGGLLQRAWSVSQHNLYPFSRSTPLAGHKRPPPFASSNALAAHAVALRLEPQHCVHEIAATPENATWKPRLAMPDNNWTHGRRLLAIETSLGKDHLLTTSATGDEGISEL